MVKSVLEEHQALRGSDDSRTSLPAIGIARGAWMFYLTRSTMPDEWDVPTERPTDLPRNP